jgi:hypothetical protein|tara:strand:- start:1802 stop:1957 length:156 start_codon:yes stop_codon:yes gene_type:complete
MKSPFDPGGILKRIPGLSIIKSVVVAIKSVCVRTRPNAFAMRENARKKTSA